MRINMAPGSRAIPVASVGASFDPLRLGADRKLGPILVPLREAELKHSRLAMLAAVGWPLAELCHPSLVQLVRTINPQAPSLLVDGRSPSLLNGGLFEPTCLPALSAAIFVASVLELIDLKKKQAAGLDAVLGTMAATYQQSRGVEAEYVVQPLQPGDVSSFDPLGMYRSKAIEEQRELMEKVRAAARGRHTSSPRVRSRRMYPAPLPLTAPPTLSRRSSSMAVSQCWR